VRSCLQIPGSGFPILLPRGIRYLGHRWGGKDEIRIEIGRRFGAFFYTGLAYAQEIADTIYSGGPILTINDAAPNAEAVAVKDGRILAVGRLDEVAAHQGDQTQMFELDGRAMLPGFVDSHGHVVFGGLQALSANLLAPPDGEVADSRFWGGSPDASI